MRLGEPYICLNIRDTITVETNALSKYSHIILLNSQDSLVDNDTCLKMMREGAQPA